MDFVVEKGKEVRNRNTNDLSAVSLPNGDVILHCAGGHEASFDVIRVIIGLCLETPASFPK